MLATLGCLGRVHTRPVFTALCTMCVSLLDHRLQHGCPGRAKGALCVLSAAMDYPAQDHPAWGRCFSIPLLPAAAAEPGRRRWIISSLLHIAPELFTIQLRSISNKILVCCLTLLAEGRRGLCKHHFAPEEANCQLKHWLRFNSVLCYFNIYQFLPSFQWVLIPLCCLLHLCCWTQLMSIWEEDPGVAIQMVLCSSSM